MKQAECAQDDHLARESMQEGGVADVGSFGLLYFYISQWRLIVGLTVLGVAVGVCLAYMLPQRYTATITFMTPQPNSSLGSALIAQMNGSSTMASLASNSLGLRSSGDMYVAMLQSRTVEDAVVKKYDLLQRYHAGLASDARMRLAKNLQVSANNKAGLISLSFTDTDQRKAAEIANGYIDEFRRLTDRLAVTEAGKRRVYFEQQLEAAKNNLDAAETAMAKTQSSSGVLELDSQAKSLIQNASSLRAQITLKEAQIQSMKTYASSENAQLVQAENGLQSMRAQLSELENGSSRGDSILLTKGKVTIVGVEYERNLRELKYRTALYELLAKQYEVARMDEAREGAVIQVVDPAVVPDKRSFPKRSLCMVSGLFAGFVLALVFLYARARYTRMVSDPHFAVHMKILRNAFGVNGRRYKVENSSSEQTD